MHYNLASELHSTMKNEYNLVRTNMQLSQSMQKSYYDKKMNFHTNYKIGDKVLVWKPISQHVMDKVLVWKPISQHVMDYRKSFSGPWEIIKILSPCNFLVNMKVHIKKKWYISTR